MLELMNCDYLHAMHTFELLPSERFLYFNSWIGNRLRCAFFFILLTCFLTVLMSEEKKKEQASRKQVK